MLRPLLFLLAAGVTLAAGTPSRYRDFILAAGNAEIDVTRLGHLRKLAYQCKVDGTQLAGLDALIAFVERWDSPGSRLEWFSREIQRTRSFDLGIDEQSPLFPIVALYRGRMLVVHACGARRASTRSAARSRSTGW